MNERADENPVSHLPVVESEVGTIALQNSKEHGYAHIVMVTRRLTDTQPYLSRMIGEWAQQTAETDVERRRMLHMALLVFELLDSQGQADAMKKQFNKP